MPSSFHPINEAVPSQDVLPIRTTATDGDRKPPKPLLDARADVDAYLRERKAPGHFLNVDTPAGPIRRQDVNGISSKQRAFTKEHYRWDDSERRWTTKSGGQLITEQEVYNTILSHQRVIGNQANDAVYEYMKTRFEGVHMRDVRKAYALWQQHKLGNLDGGDDILWGGPAATIGKNILTKSLILRPDLHSVPHEDPLMTPDDSDSDSASAYGPEGHATTNDKTPQPLSTSNYNYTFHPHKPHTLLVGTSGNDGKNAWLSLIERPGRLNSYRATFYDHRGIKHTENQLNVVWHDEFRYSTWPEADKDGNFQKRMQRQRIYGILKEHEVQLAVQGGPSGQVPKNGATRLPRQTVADSTLQAASDVEPNLHTTNSKRRQSSRRKSSAVLSNGSSDSSDDDIPLRQAKRPRRVATLVGPVATPTQESSNDVEFVSTRPIRPECTSQKTSASTTANLPSSAIAATTLLVSASNQPALAPVYVPFTKCTTHEKLFETLDSLFETLVTTFNLKDKAACDFNAVSATYTWNKKTQLILRGRDDDWASFLRILETAWKKESRVFEEDGCEIGLLVHVNG